MRLTFDVQGVFPNIQSGPYLQDNAQLLCLDTILEQIKHMTNRLDSVSKLRSSSCAPLTSSIRLQTPPDHDVGRVQ